MPKMPKMPNLLPDPNAIADYIHLSKYARYIPDLHRRETFKETVLRVRRMHTKKFPQLKKEINKAFDFVLNKKVLPSMRSMQFAGKPLLERNERMYNCSFTLIDRPEVFGQILYLLLCGVGVGFSVQKSHIEKLPIIKKIDTNLICHHSIVDTIEGWADAITSLINGFINGYFVEFNYSKIRPVGSSLQSGGKAPGHLDLKEALESTRTILSQAENRKLKPIECHDIICHLSKAVLAGGIRRSSLISLFSKDDVEMFHAKYPSVFDFEGTNTQRALCNNSVVLNPNKCEKKDLEFIINLNKESFGEPGFIFLENEDWGINPCGEIGLDPIWEHKSQAVPGGIIKQTGFGFCNLVEVNAAGCNNEQDFYNACHAASFIATLQASHTNFPYLEEVTEKIVKRDALIGVSITGMMDTTEFNIFDSGILQAGANEVKETNKLIAYKIGINPAKRCTCIKPGGTSSLEFGGVSTGIHPHIAKNYFKRITANPLEPVAQFFAKYNPSWISEKPNGDLCITFPISTKGLTWNDFTAIEFLEKIYQVYENWILPTHYNFQQHEMEEYDKLTHNISCTIQVRENEWDKILNNIWQNRNKIRCMTFLPVKAYKKIPFMPNEPVKMDTFEQRQEWRKYLKSYKLVDYELMEEFEDVTLRGAACDSDSCSMNVEDRTFISGNGYRIFEGIHRDCNFVRDNIFWKFIEQKNGYFIAQRIK